MIKQAFVNGWIAKCKEFGVDPITLTKYAQGVKPITPPKPIPPIKPTTPSATMGKPPVVNATPAANGGVTVATAAKPKNQWARGGVYYNAAQEMMNADRAGFTSFMKQRGRPTDAAGNMQAMRDYYASLSSEQKAKLMGTDAFKAMQAYKSNQTFDRTLQAQGMGPGTLAKDQFNAGLNKAAPGHNTAEDVALANGFTDANGNVDIKRTSNFMAENQKRLEAQRNAGGVYTYIDPRTGQVVTGTGNQHAEQRRQQALAEQRRRAMAGRASTVNYTSYRNAY